MHLLKGTHEEILDFVETNFGAKDKFIWFEKGQVNGKNTREVYSFLKQKLPSEDGTKDIRYVFKKNSTAHMLWIFAYKILLTLLKVELRQVLDRSRRKSCKEIQPQNKSRWNGTWCWETVGKEKWQIGNLLESKECFGRHCKRKLKKRLHEWQLWFVDICFCFVSTTLAW